MSAKPRDLGMTPLDDLFSTDESRAEAHLEKVVTLNPADISDFPNHPFKVKQDEAMAEMVDSVKQYGVLVPALVRPKADGGYEMVAGHRRKCAATLAGITEMPCILNRVTLNWKKGKRTHIFIDEFHVVFENEQSGIFFNSAWRQFRKRNGYPTAITQNVEYLLDSVQASTMLSNSEFVVMLNQAFSDRAKLSKLLNISDEQMSYVTNADAGCGLIKYGSALVPFINRFPKDTELYRLMTTRPGEGVFGSGNAS